MNGNKLPRDKSYDRTPEGRAVAGLTAQEKLTPCTHAPDLLR